MKNSVPVYSRKRTTFWKIFAKAAAVALVITALFSFAVAEFVGLFISEQMNTSVSETLSLLQSRINSMQNSNRTEEIQADLCQFTYFETGVWQHWFPTVTTSDEGNAAYASLIDNDGSKFLDNRRMFITLIKFDMKGSPANGRYFCDYNKLGITQLKEIERKYENLEKAKYAVYNVKTAVINEETREFVPVDIDVVTFETVRKTFEARELSTESYTIDTNGFEGRYVEFTGGFGKEEKYPMSGVTGFWGSDDAAMKTGNDHLYDDITGNMAVYSESDTDTSDLLSAQQSRTVYIDGKEYNLWVGFFVHKWCKGTKLFWLLGTLCAFLGTMFIALLYSWRKNTINKAQYAFEDYQRTLTNNLAHDIKTPLAAIGGYAENLLSHCQTEKEKRYLTSILDNVSFTDQLVCRTLDLNKCAEMKKLNVTEFSLKDLVTECVGKYQPLIEQNDCELVIEGDTTIKTDRAQYLTALENLISNAVKYSTNDGNIRITIRDKSMTVANSISGRIDTTSLKMPFVKVDKSRSDRSGSGLGLSIAEAALNACGSALEIDSSDTEFTSTITY